MYDPLPDESPNAPGTNSVLNAKQTPKAWLGGRPSPSEELSQATHLGDELGRNFCYQDLIHVAPGGPSLFFPLPLLLPPKNSN